MYSNSGARKSVDSLSPTASIGPRGEFPFHQRDLSSSTIRPHNRRGSTASSLHSVGGSLDTASGGWSGGTVLESGQNAISTLLQPPIVRTGQLPHVAPPASSSHKPPTARDIPPVTLTNITRVDSADFKPYLSQVGPLYEQLRRVKESDDDGASLFSRRGSKPDDGSDIMDEGYLKPSKRGHASRKASIASISSIEAPSPVRRSSSGFRRGTAQGPPPLSTIPTVYFDDDFHLENPRTFDVVSERSEVVRPAPGSVDASNGSAAAPRKALATNAILQEKLSWYMDTVEMHLIQSISTASTTFFSALGSLKELHSEAADSVDRIKALRKELSELDEEIATTGLHIVHERRRQENLQQLYDAVVQLREVVEGLAACEAQVDAGEVDQALDGIDALESLISGQETALRKGKPKLRLRNLRGATALQSVSADLETLRVRIGKAYEIKFVSVLMGDLKRHVETVSTQEVLMRWSSASARARGGHSREPSTFPSYMSSTDAIRSELLSSLDGLYRAKHIVAAITTFREAALKEVKNLVRRPLPSSNDDDNESTMSSSTVGTGGRRRTQQEKSSVLARNLRALEPEDAEALLVKIYTGVTETLRRLSTQAKVLLDVATSIGDPSDLGGSRSPIKSPPFSPGGRQPNPAALELQAEIHRSLDLANLSGQAVDVAQDRIVKLLRVRSEQSKTLSLTWFLRYFTLNLHFANECESISGRGGMTLKTVVNGHIKDFVQHHGDMEKQQLAQGMESDQWNAIDFSDRDTGLLRQILDCSTRDAPAWSEGTKIWIPQPDTESDTDADSYLNAQAAHVNGNGSGSGNGNGNGNGSAKPKMRSAVIDGEHYLLPNSAVLSMNGMAHFLHLVVGIPSMTADIASSLISYLQLFNSRCTQLILGAGATRSAGLKNITTKHLALASQALAFTAALIPHVREFVRRRGGSSAAGGAAVQPLMAEFDRVRRLYQEHQNSIYDKLVEIMSGRAAAGAKKMRAIDWDSSGSAKGSGGVHEYMETLVKETTTLHRNLTKHLPEGTVRLIMLPVFRSYKETFGSALMGAEPRTEVGRSSMIQDIAYFQNKLGKIDGFDDAGDYLLDIAKGKDVKSVTPATIAKPTDTQASTPAAATTKSADKQAVTPALAAQAQGVEAKDTPSEEHGVKKSEDDEKKEAAEVTETAVPPKSTTTS